jgi:sugar lactone lactonase YvrE
MIAFTAFQQNRSMLWIRTLDSPESRIIPGTAAANQVFWSPDSRSLGFFTTDRLWRVDLAGGPAQRIRRFCSNPAGMQSTRCLRQEEPGRFSSISRAW